MQRTAWVHIGTPKTGSSSLQRLMRLNRDSVAAQQLELFDKALPGTGSLERYAAEDRHVRRARVRKQQTDPQAIKKYRSRLEASLAKAVRESDLTTWFFSDENLTFLSDESEFLRLKSLLAPHFEAIRIIVYIRAQHDRAVSAFSQRLRMGETSTEILRIPDAEGNNRHTYFYDNFLRNWVTHFGRENVTVRIFDRADLLDGDVVADIFDIVGLSKNEIADPGDKNLAFSLKQQAFLLHVNKYIRPFSGGQINMVRDHMLKAMQDMPREDKGGVCCRTVLNPTLSR